MLGWRTRAGLAVLTLALAGAGARPAGADEWTLQTGIHVDAYDGPGQSGHQLLAPFGLAFDTPRWGASLRGAFGNSERDPGGAPRGAVTGLVDTTLSGYLRLAAAGVEWLGALDLDLPTGKSRLSRRQAAAFTDEDLNALDRFGEGLDVNPSVVAYRSFGAFGLGIGVGYLLTGEFDPTRDTPADDLDPGDELTVAVLGDTDLADVLHVLLRASYTTFGADRRGGRRVFREGDEIDVRAVLTWRPEPWFAELTVRDVVRLKAERPDGAGRLRAEPHRSAGNDLRVAASLGYILADTLTVQGTAAVRYVAANGYPAADPLHDGGRVKVALGPAVTWSPTRTVAVDAGVAYFVLDVERSPTFPRPGTFHGVHADFRITYRF